MGGAWTEKPSKVRFSCWESPGGWHVCALSNATTNWELLGYLLTLVIKLSSSHSANWGLVHKQEMRTSPLLCLLREGE